MSKTNLQIHSEKEFELLIKHQETLEEGERLCLDVKNYQKAFELIGEAFSQEGASGGAAPYLIKTLTSLLENYLSWMPLSPITFEDDQFVKDDERFLKQHKRASFIFKNDEGIVYNIRGVVFKDVSDNSTFTTSNMKYGDSVIRSRQIINKDVLLPSELKPIVINVTKINDDDYVVLDSNDEKTLDIAIKNSY